MTLSFHYTPDDYYEAVTGAPKPAGVRAMAQSLAGVSLFLALACMLGVLLRWAAPHEAPPAKALWLRILYAAVPSLLLAALVMWAIIRPAVKGPPRPWEQQLTPGGAKPRTAPTPAMIVIILGCLIPLVALSWVNPRETAASPGATARPLAGWTFHLSDPDLLVPLIPWVLLVSGAVLASVVQQRRGLYKLWEVQPPLRRPHQVEFSDHGAVVVDDVTRTVSKWQAFEGFRETPNLFVLYTSPLAFLIVPKRAFADESQADVFRGMALNCVGKASFLPQAGRFPVQRVLPLEAAPPGAQPA